MKTKLFRAILALLPIPTEAKAKLNKHTVEKAVKEHLPPEKEKEFANLFSKPFRLSPYSGKNRAARRRLSEGFFCMSK